MADRKVCCLAAGVLVALAAGFFAVVVRAGEEKDDFSELRLAVESPAQQPRTGKTTDNSGSRYRPADDKKSQPEGRYNKGKTDGAGTDKSGRRAPEDVKREKLAKMIAARLEKLAPLSKAKKDPDDRFLVGTSEVRLAESHADVRFESIQGQKEVANFLAGYVVDAPPQTLRQWHVFARAKSVEEAEGFLKDLRAQWDALEQLQAQQAEMARSMSLAYRSASDLRRQMGGYARSMCRT